ncbi:uncharacterized protein LOC118797512 [Colossoma macropomum]|uniref:uncharacterized protein LOC118797512 n=1 Tax=Colossoma macropomum TaxID=42526 RepID=UPI00186494ED|nr:uncharacterized protein LOC118797512 [Colossoma macropomum]
MSSKEMSEESPAQRCKTNKGRCQQIGCERTTEEEKEDVDDEDHPESGPSMLWEKRFEQSIFVDISDDDSLHLSDLQGSFRVHVSQDQGSMHSSGNTGLSHSYEVEQDSSESTVSISSEHKDHGHIRDVKGNEAKASVPYPKTAPERPRWRPDDDNTSDEDQEELPYDGELHHNYMLHTESPTENSKELRTVNGTYQQGSGALCTLSKPSRDAEKVNGGVYNTDQPIVGVIQGQEPSRVSASVPEFLLRHFSQDELLNCGRLIEAETMPEVSLLDSIDETARSRASANLHTTSGVGGHSAKIKASLCLLEENEYSRGESHTASEVTDSKTRSTETTAHRNKNNDQLVNRSAIHNQSDSTVESRTSCISNGDSSPFNLAEGEKEDQEENAGHSCSASTPNLPKADIQCARFLLGRTRSCSELKYGQGQVHYPLPDFSKVAPKVKIPKGNGPTKPGCHTSSADRTHTTAGILGKSPSSCTADVISRVLEDSVWLTEMRKDEEKQSRLDQHLQAEYNRLLAKYPEDDNLINLMRPRDQIQASSEQSPSTHRIETVSGLDITQGTAQTRAAPQTSQSIVEGLVEEKRDAVPSSLSVQQSISEGQRLTTELRAIIEQFMKKVEEFKKCISNMSLTVEEQQEMFKGMMEAQDQLERNYMSKKEEHRVLEMQNYMGLDRNTGEFDPDRQVEGEIFRLGMQLEDIKEQIDRNTHHAFSLPHSSSTPTPSVHGEFIPSTSHQPTLHEEQVFSFFTSVVEEEEHFKAIDGVPGAADSPLSCPSENSFRLHIFSQTPCISREDEEGSVSVPGEEDYCEDFLAQLTEPASPNHQRTPNRPEDIGFHTQDPPEQHTNKAQLQRFVSPETDSGFGASDQSRPPTGLSHTQCNTESLSPSDDVGSMTSVSTSDNEASHSNLHTAVSVATWAGWAQMGDSEPDQVSKNVQNIHRTRTQENCTTQNAQVGLHTMAEAPLCEGATLHSVPLQDPSQEDQLAQIQNPTAVEMPARYKPLHCSCPNSEAISALQYEVSRLKRALEESLGHLPHLSMRMEHLSSMYSQEKRPRSRPRSRHQHRLSSSSRCLNTDLDLQRMEGWNSSDIEPSKIKASLESLSQDTSRSKPGTNHRRAGVGPTSPGGNISIGPGSQNSDANIGSLSDNKTASVRPTSHSRTASIEPIIHGSRSSAGLGNNGSFGLTNNRSRANTGCTPPGESLCLMDRHVPPPLHLLHKPLLQTNYGSCNSLPPGFKVQDQQSDPETSSRRRSTQSDTAMLPSNVYFQRTSPLPTSPCKTRGRSRRQRVKEEAINRTLDKALEAALMMKQTTDRMAKTLSADLAKAQIYRKFQGLHPLSDMEQP